MKQAILLVLILIMAFPVFAQDEDEEVSDTPDVIEYIVASNSAVNLRSGPGTSNSIVGTVDAGSSIFIYDEDPEVDGWLRVYREGEVDAYIADFLLERAPERFYDPSQEPIAVVEGRGRQVSDVFDLPQGAYRFDAVVEDRSFIFGSVVLEGDCRDDTIFNELDFDKSRLIISGLFVSSGCSVIFESENVDGAWTVEIRSLLDEAYFEETLLEIEDGTSIAANGRQLTMATLLPVGIWTINANVQDSAFILRSHVLIGDCDDTAVLNEFDEEPLELSTVYRSENDSGDACIIFWETSNVEGNWEVTFEQLR